MAVGNDPSDDSNLTVHALNVGQADAIAITTKNDEIVLLDADKKTVKEQLDTVVADQAPSKTEDGKIPLTFGVTHIGMGGISRRQIYVL